MIPPIDGVSKMPKQCPICEAKLCKEWALGVMPKLLGIVNLVIRCNQCEEVFSLSMPMTLVNPLLKSLPNDESGIFRLFSEKPSSRITTSEEDDAVEKMKADGGQSMIKAFAVIEEYDALGYYDKDDQKLDEDDREGYDYDDDDDSDDWMPGYDDIPGEMGW